MYEWIAKEKGTESVTFMCRVLKVWRPGYYRHIGCGGGVKERNAKVLSELKAIRQENPEYGTERARRELSAGERCSYGKAYRLRKENGLLCERHRKRRTLTKQNDEDQLSEDLLKRDFSAAEPNKKWLGDITQAQCKDGNLYIAGVFDCFDGALVGLSMQDHMRAELCVEALSAAAQRYGHPPGLIFHSDRGSQYTSNAYRSRLEKYGFRQSMGRTGSCYDNARMESFWATLKKERLYSLPLSTLTREQVRRIVFRWIECRYNRKRLYSANPDYLPPLVYRERWLEASPSHAA